MRAWLAAPADTPLPQRYRPDPDHLDEADRAGRAHEALLFAARAGQVAALEALCDAADDLDALRAALGDRHPDRAQVLGTPGVLLRNAALAGRADVCAWLIAAGADPGLRSPVGATAAEVAEAAGHGVLAGWLRERGGAGGRHGVM